MSISVGVVGKAFRYSTSYDMSGYSALTLNFTKPDGTTLQKTQVSSNPVTAPAVALVADPDLGDVAASTYMEFITIATDFDQAGKWSVCGIYEDLTPKKFPGLSASFTVLSGCS